MKVAILGGGVAGVSTAIALKQKGFDVSVYERHDSPTTIGAGIVVWPNAAFVLEQLAVLSEIAAISGSPIEMRRVSRTCENLGGRLTSDRSIVTWGIPVFPFSERIFKLP